MGGCLSTVCPLDTQLSLTFTALKAKIQEEYSMINNKLSFAAHYVGTPAPFKILVWTRDKWETDGEAFLAQVYLLACRRRGRRGCPLDHDIENLVHVNEPRFKWWLWGKYREDFNPSLGSSWHTFPVLRAARVALMKILPCESYTSCASDINATITGGDDASDDDDDG